MTTTNPTIGFEYEMAAYINDEGKALTRYVTLGREASFWDGDGFDGSNDGRNDPAFIGAALYYVVPNDADVDDDDFEPICISVAGDHSCAWTASGSFEAIPAEITDDIEAVLAWALSR